MKQLLALVKNNLKVRHNLAFGEKGEESMKKSTGMALLIVFLIASIEFSVINGFDILKVQNKQELIFKVIINLELVFISIYSFKNILNTCYLASDWREMSIYPLKPGIYLISKCILTVLQNFFIESIFMLPLFSYGVLDNRGIGYYAYVIGYNILIAVTPVAYITLILLTILWFSVLITKSKRENRSNKLLVIVDILVVGLSLGMLNSNVWIKAAAFMGTTIFSLLGSYLIGGNVYFTIMKSELFNKSDTKIIEQDIGKYKFNEKNIVISNILRDIKMILRVPAMRTNCIMSNVVISLIGIVLMLLASDKISELSRSGLKGAVLIPLILLLTTANFTSITSFSREGKSIVQFKVFPMDSNKFLIAKICVGLISNVFTFITSNVFIILICTNFVDFILLEVMLISYIFMMVVVHTKMDSNNIYSGWVDIKELFQLEHFMKIYIPITIITILDYAYLFTTIAIKFKNEEMLTFVFFMIISVVWSVIDIGILKKDYVKKC